MNKNKRLFIKKIFTTFLILYSPLINLKFKYNEYILKKKFKNITWILSSKD